MSYQLFGSDPIVRGEAGGPFTAIDAYSASISQCRGIMKSFSVYIVANVTVFKLKIFRDDGTNFIFIGESPAYSLNAGLNSDLLCWIPVEKNDRIGSYQASGTISCATGGGTRYNKNGDIITTSTKASWTLDAYSPYSIQGRVYTIVGSLWI